MGNTCLKAISEAIHPYELSYLSCLRQRFYWFDWRSYSECQSVTLENGLLLNLSCDPSFSHIDVVDATDTMIGS